MRHVLTPKPGLFVRSFDIQRGMTRWMALWAISKATVRVALKVTPQVPLTVESSRHPANRSLRKRWKLPSSVACEACLFTFAVTRSATATATGTLRVQQFLRAKRPTTQPYSSRAKATRRAIRRLALLHSPSSVYQFSNFSIVLVLREPSSATSP